MKLVLPFHQSLLTFRDLHVCTYMLIHGWFSTQWLNFFLLASDNKVMVVCSWWQQKPDLFTIFHQGCVIFLFAFTVADLPRWMRAAFSPFVSQLCTYSHTYIFHLLFGKMKLQGVEHQQHCTVCNNKTHVTGQIKTESNRVVGGEGGKLSSLIYLLADLRLKSRQPWQLVRFSRHLVCLLSSNHYWNYWNKTTQQPPTFSDGNKV